jgi:hypothetical protein
MTTATETATKPVSYTAKCVNQRLTIEPAYVRRDPLTGLPVDTFDGTHAQFEEHKFTTSDPAMIAALDNHRLLNLSFWRDDAPPDEPKPTTKSQLHAITKALVAGNRDALAAVVAEERETHNRALVLEQADQAREALDAADEAARPDPRTAPDAP